MIDEAAAAYSSAVAELDNLSQSTAVDPRGRSIAQGQSLHFQAAAARIRNQLDARLESSPVGLPYSSATPRGADAVNAATTDSADAGREVGPTEAAWPAPPLVGPTVLRKAEAATPDVVAVEGPLEAATEGALRSRLAALRDIPSATPSQVCHLRYARLKVRPCPFYDIATDLKAFKHSFERTCYT
jgi:hypothetical protein